MINLFLIRRTLSTITYNSHVFLSKAPRKNKSGVTPLPAHYHGPVWAHVQHVAATGYVLHLHEQILQL